MFTKACPECGKTRTELLSINPNFGNENRRCKCGKVFSWKPVYDCDKGWATWDKNKGKWIWTKTQKA